MFREEVGEGFFLSPLTGLNIEHLSHSCTCLWHQNGVYFKRSGQYQSGLCWGGGGVKLTINVFLIFLIFFYKFPFLNKTAILMEKNVNDYKTFNRLNRQI